MTDEPIEIIHGSGNVFADFDHPNAAIEQLKALLAAKIIGVLDDRAITVRKAEAITCIAAADFSRIRKARLDRFTIDRLMTILSRLDQEIDVQVTVRSHHAKANEIPIVNLTREKQGSYATSQNVI